jgi:hypothetical protein
VGHPQKDSRRKGGPPASYPSDAARYTSNGGRDQRPRLELCALLPKAEASAKRIDKGIILKALREV